MKIIIHGYNSDMFLTPLIQMKTEYLQRGSFNLFYVDWSLLAPGPCYPSAVHNTKYVGRCIAQLVERILDAGTSNIHLIGFSLGAHVTNFVANSLEHFKIPRITGLDPAMPLFITANANDKLDKSDAEFVDVIHTNALVQGKIEQCGHVDFYMNGGVMQPGCFSGGESINCLFYSFEFILNYNFFTDPFACSHHRAPDYFSESIRSFKGFWGYECASYINYLFGLCPPSSFLVLAGEDCRPDTKQGTYFITTNHESPFAYGRWTDLSPNSKGVLKLNKPFSRRDPLHTQFDQWGKLEGSFNNIVYFPTPYSQDPNGKEWPYLDKSSKNVLEDSNFISKQFLSSNFSSNSDNFTLPVFNTN